MQHFVFDIYSCEIWSCNARSCMERYKVQKFVLYLYLFLFYIYICCPHPPSSSAGLTPNLGADERISAWYDSGHEGEINFANVIGCASSSTECTCLLPYWTGKFYNFPFGCKIQVLLTKWHRADSFRITTAWDGLSQRSWKMVRSPFILKYFNVRKCCL